MAIEILPSVEAQYRFPNQPLMHAIIRLAKLKKAYRRFLAERIPLSGSSISAPCAVTNALERSKNAFLANGWAYLEGYFDEEFHRQLVANWPSSRYFEPARTMAKSYDMGFRWKYNYRSPDVDAHPAIKAVADYLGSDEFAARVTDYCGDGIPRMNYSGYLNRAFSGSSIIPHKDAVSELDIGDGFINIVCFVDGSGGRRSGGLCIMDGGEFEDVVFEPENVTNCAIIYRSSANLWHGFAPMRLGAFRWAINSQFGPKAGIEAILASEQSS